MIKKNIIFITLFILLVPTIVFAKDTCNDNDIIIKSISLKSSNGFTEEVNESTISNNKINLDLKMYNIGDSIEYNILIKNNSNKDYYFTSDSLKIDNDYLEYSLLNDNDVIKPGEERNIQLKISYKNKIPNNSFNDTNKVSINLSDKPLINPQTNRNYMYIFIFIIFICLSIYLRKKNMNISNKKLFIIFSLISIIPISVYAMCNIKIDIETKISIDEREANFLPGREVNIKMKQLAGDDTSTVTNGYTFQDENITAIKYSSGEPNDNNKEEKNIVSTSESPYPIYMWYDNGTIYWWSEDIHPNLNEDSNGFFYNMKSLNDIGGLINWDASKVIVMEGMFASNSSLQSLESLRNWDVSNVTNMSSMFAFNVAIQSLEGLKDWDVSSVTKMNIMFGYNSSLQSLEPLINWDTSNVTTMIDMFISNSSIQSLEPLSNWNISNVTNMTGIFINNKALTVLTGLEKWDVANVTNMTSMFSGNSNLTSIAALKDWNVSSVTNFKNMFNSDSLITNSDSINDWNIQSSATFTQMFRNVPTHPEFSKVIGTWNSNGTFTPTT